MFLHPILTLAAISVAFLCAMFDGATGTIPNRLILPVLVAAPLVHFALGGPGGLGASLLGMAACAAVPLFLFLRGGMGGGDVKLLAALGALVGVGAGLRIELCALFLALAYALVLLLRRGGMLRALTRSLRMLRHPLSPLPLHASTSEGPAGTTLRLGPPVGLAAYVVLQHPHALAWMVP